MILKLIFSRNAGVPSARMSESCLARSSSAMASVSFLLANAPGPSKATASHTRQPRRVMTDSLRETVSILRIFLVRKIIRRVRNPQHFPLSKLLIAHPDPPHVLPRALQRNLHIPLAHQLRKFLSPLDQQNAIVAPQIVQRKRLQFTLGVDAIQIDVIELGPRPAIF